MVQDCLQGINDKGRTVSEFLISKVFVHKQGLTFRDHFFFACVQSLPVHRTLSACFQQINQATHVPPIAYEINFLCPPWIE